MAQGPCSPAHVALAHPSRTEGHPPERRGVVASQRWSLDDSLDDAGPPMTESLECGGAGRG